MKPEKMTPAHHSEDFAELVCSNSLRGDRLENAVGLLKEELRRLRQPDSRTAPMRPGWRRAAALAVDRDGFSRLVTKKIRNHPRYHGDFRREVTESPRGAGDRGHRAADLRTL